MVETFTCEWHGCVVPIEKEHPGCPDCNVFLDDPPDSAQMTGEERAAELRGWFDRVLTVRFPRLHERIEALVGRSVWTHEMGVNVEGLIQEAASGQHPEDLRRHVIDSMCDAVGAEKVFVADVPSSTESRAGGADA